MLMAIRKIQLATGEYYHIFNRGVDKRTIFQNQRDVQRFFRSMCEFNTIEPIGSIHENSFKKKGLRSRTPKLPESRLVDIVCYCLNSNHYHLIVKQVADKGVEKFIQKLGTGYTNYFNTKYKRSGVLFQGKYKAVYIDSNEQLLHTSVYVNLNFRVHQLGSPASKLIKPLSSWDEYAGKMKFDFCQKDGVLGQFKNKKEYKEFAERTLPSILERKEILRELEE